MRSRSCVALTYLLFLASIANPPTAVAIDIPIFVNGFEDPAPCSGPLCDLGFCSSEGASCTLDADCCSLNCDGGICGAAAGACKVQGASCGSDGDCCSLACATTCGASGGDCGPIGESCSTGNSCCSGFCAGSDGAGCASGGIGCRCAPALECRAQGELCAADADCCNSYCDRPGDATVGLCTKNVATCETAGEPCSPTGSNGSCCSGQCVDASGIGAGTCGRLGGCLPASEICANGLECCSGSCEQSATTDDGRPIMRCAASVTCLLPGDTCALGGVINCCPPGGGDIGCTTSSSGASRCVGGTAGCVLPGAACTDTSECCTETYANVQCQAGSGGSDVCCLSAGQSCALGDVCCSGVCAPNAEGQLVCAAGCLAAAASCTTNADCCSGSCRDQGEEGLRCAAE
jgi:hypothetical protein